MTGFGTSFTRLCRSTEKRSYKWVLTQMISACTPFGKGPLCTVPAEPLRVFVRLGQPAQPIRKVELVLPSSMDAYKFGQLGRQSMLNMLEPAELDFDSEMFRAKVVWS